ncbi:hypothetical protein B0H15DRAFT_807299 [Mycena belliarum]|uniref:Uncharacterized protein n=1 Tax=Mycena belliarum TaxID=1033014 RepID=A0AAD6TLG4_9AGAR|nr:hypothetical protein B0H15DRAFT_807299 [Mycena belliae]
MLHRRLSARGGSEKQRVDGAPKSLRELRGFSCRWWMGGWHTTSGVTCCCTAIGRRHCAKAVAYAYLRVGACPEARQRRKGGRSKARRIPTCNLGLAEPRRVEAPCRGGHTGAPRASRGDRARLQQLRAGGGEGAYWEWAGAVVGSALVRPYIEGCGFWRMAFG